MAHGCNHQSYNSILKFDFQIPDDPVTIINDKFDLEEFEELDDEAVRIIGYFEPGSVALKEFEEAAEDFMGEIEFFAVVTSQVSILSACYLIDALLFSGLASSVLNA